MADSFLLSNLPVELVRDILEYAAHSDRATARNLTLVSSAVRHWTDPILFDTVILSSARSLRAFLDAITNRPVDFVRTRVRNLAIFTVGPTQTIDHVLSACSGVHNIACGFSLSSYQRTPGVSALQSVARPHEQHLLGLACRDGWDASLVGSTVTHLRIHLASFDSSRPDCPFPFSGTMGESGWSRLAALPSLTHLAIVYRPSGATSPASIVPHLMRLFLSPDNENGLPALQLILIQVTGAKKDASFATEAVVALNCAAAGTGGSARRIVAEHAPSSPARQWEDAVRGGQSVWKDAEAILQARLAHA